MKIEILNQFTQVWEVDGHKTEEVYRTSESIEALKERLNFNGRVSDGKWSDDGKVSAVFGILNDAQGSISKASEFIKKPFGKRGFHTLEEVLRADLIWIRGYGIISDEDKEKVKQAFQTVKIT